MRVTRVTRSALRSEHVDLSGLARDAARRLSSAHPGRDVDLTIADGLVARGDDRLLTVVLDNLLGNAWKFTSKRPGARVEFGRGLEDGQPVYFVRDNGAGFDMAYASKLFGVFQRLHRVTEYEGTGIGLATVQRIVRRHGGRVWAEGEVDRGATFYFTLENREET